MDLPKLILITDSQSASLAKRDLLETFLAASEAIAETNQPFIIQIRDKSLSSHNSPQLFADFANTFVDAITQHVSVPPYFVVNGASNFLFQAPCATYTERKQDAFQGVHLTSEESARGILGEIIHKYTDIFVSASCHTLRELQRVQDLGVTYASISPLFFTQSKPGYGPAIGLERLKELVEFTSIPLFALGGIDLCNVKSVIKSNCYGVAVMGALYRSSDPRTFVLQMIDELYS